MNFYTQLNRENKDIVRGGIYPDSLVIAPDLAEAVRSINSTVRRVREERPGYVVQELLLSQGNMVTVDIDVGLPPGTHKLLKL